MMYSKSYRFIGQVFQHGTSELRTSGVFLSFFLIQF